VANRSYLLAVDDRSITWSDDPEHEIIAEGINEIPVFWASLFVNGDKQVDAYEGEDDEGNAKAIMIPNWCVSSETAKQRLAALREPIGKLLDERSREVWFSFVDFLSTMESTYFKTNTAEVWNLAPDGFQQYWETLLRPFTEPTSENLKAAIEANGLDFEDGSVNWDEEEETICKLAGADHIRDVPWLDD
jgi:hypothetical protein